MSSYRLGSDGTLATVTGSLNANGRATCWIITTANGRFAYAVNAGSASLTGFAVSDGGALRLLDSDRATGTTGDGSVPLDPAFSTGDRYL